MSTPRPPRRRSGPGRAFVSESDARPPSPWSASLPGPPLRRSPRGPPCRLSLPDPPRRESRPRPSESAPGGATPSRPAMQIVVAGPSARGVPPAALGIGTGGVVVAAIAIEPVVAPVAVDLVVAAPPGEVVLVGPADHRVVASLAERQAT